MKIFRTIHICLVFACLIVFSAAGVAPAAEQLADDNKTGAPVDYTMEDMVVSASKVEEAIETIPKHVTVITGQDIRESAGRNIIDLLGREAGINIRSNFGTDKHSVVDLRGMGDTAASNVIVMVDGLSINSPDMSGPGIAAIPLEQIERIEVVRGAGSVVYGSGAVGGVVNIITRKPGEDPAGNVFFSYGSYDTRNSRAAIEGSAGDLGMNLSAGLYDSDGYRDNGFLKKKDLDAGAVYDLCDRLSLLLSGTYYEDEYGLPGPVSGADIQSRSRRVKTDYPDDYGETTEIRGIAGVEIDLYDQGILTLKRGYIKRDVDFVMGFTDAIPKNDQKTETEEDTRVFDLNYVKDYRFFERYHTLQVGLDHDKTEYVRENAYNGIRRNSKTESFGIFINNQLQITDNLLVNAGSRYNTYQGRFRTDEKKLFADNVRMWVNGETTRKDWNNNAWAGGVSYSVSADSSLFASYNTSFRIPNVDEFAESEAGLRPQQGRHLEFGGRQRFGAFARLTISFFDIRIEDEIYYSDINRNYEDTTIRQGVEADIKVYPVDFLNFWGNYTYTDARFDEKSTTVPLVPTHTLSAGVAWMPADPWRISFSGTYTGSRYDGNDTDNKTYAKLDDHAVFDVEASYMRGGITVFAGINNIFDNLCESSAYSQQYYPMPERNIFGGVRWAFM